MPKLICTLPNASELINGIRFFKHRLGMISEEIDEKVAEKLATIHGFFIHDPKTPNEGVPDPRATGLYNLSQAARYIASEGGEDYQQVLVRLNTAVRNSELPIYLPGQNLKLEVRSQAGLPTQPHPPLILRDDYQQTRWDELNAWLEKYERHVRCRFPNPGASSDRANSASVRPLQRRVHQEQEILRVIRVLGYDPKAVPKLRGTKSVKAQVREYLGYSQDVMKKAWHRLRYRREIADATA